MRNLTSRQKKVLDQWARDNPDKVHLGFSVDEDMDTGTWDVLERLNDTEILWQEVNRYISDKAVSYRKLNP